MKFFTISLLLFSFALTYNLNAQNYRQLDQPEWPEAQGDSVMYTVGGERHGISFFKQHRFPEVEYQMGETLTFDQYHTVDVMYGWYQKWAEEYPDIVDLYEVTKSFEGRPILQMTITNKETGKHTDKPAAYFEGGRHSGEITSSESILWLTKHLLENYGKDEEITELIDTKAIYLRPQNNPDGSNLYLHTAQANRSSVRPHDNDHDGLLDEDSPADLDGDGIIYEMRRKADEDELDEANYIIDPRDSEGRLMKRVPEGKGEWFVYDEGVDSDGDGEYNEDGIGGLDLHRNYPENWRPGIGVDETGRGYEQLGAGAYPMSEPESKSVVMWMLTHPNISVVNSMDTRVPMHLRPPSTSKSEERMYPEDLALYEKYDAMGLEITDYPWAGDVYETYMTRYPENRVTGDPSYPRPLFGHGPDFGYFYFGSIWYGDELWNNGAMEDYNDDGIYDDYDAIVWDDRENGGEGFKDWESFNHPQLGEVEIGGFHPKFFSQNGPPSQLEHWAEKQALFNLAMAKELPQLEIDDLQVIERDDNIYEVTLDWTNTGNLPVALKQAQLVKIVQEDRVELEFEEDLTKGYEDARVKILEPSTFDKTIKAGYTGAGETKSATFVVELNGVSGAEGTLKLISTRGGYIERPVTLGDPE